LSESKDKLKEIVSPFSKPSDVIALSNTTFEEI